MADPAWKLVPCPTCVAVKGEMCIALAIRSTGYAFERRANRPHAARNRAATATATATATGGKERP